PNDAGGIPLDAVDEPATECLQRESTCAAPGLAGGCVGLDVFIAGVREEHAGGRGSLEPLSAVVDRVPGDQLRPLAPLLLPAAHGFFRGVGLSLQFPVEQ